MLILNPYYCADFALISWFIYVSEAIFGGFSKDPLWLIMSTIYFYGG